jgi:hypothetical protein
MNRLVALQHFISVCARPGMYAQENTYAAVCAYISGFDTALCGGILFGFREWLLMRGTEWNNIPWWGLVRVEVTGPFAPADRLTEEQDRALLARLAELLGEFSQASQRGLDRCLFEYGSWLQDRGRPFDDS